jgi:hypothetical protein
MPAAEMTDRAAGASAFLRALARVLGGHYHLRAAMADPAGPRARLARVFMDRVLPDHEVLCQRARAGAGPLYALSVADLVA